MASSSVARHWLPVALCCLAAGGGASAQSTPTRLYGTADGLPHLTVRSITQSPDGRIWVGTNRGIAAYDCCRWTAIDVGQPFGSNGSASTPALVARDEDGAIWALGSHTPIAAARRLADRWLPLPLQTGDVARTNITAVAVSSRGGHAGALVGTGSGQLFRYDGRTPGAAGWRRIPLRTRAIRGIARIDGYYYIAHAGGAARLPVDPIDDIAEAIPGLPAGDVAAVTGGEDEHRAWLFGHGWIASCGLDETTVHLHDAAFAARTMDPITTALGDDRGGVHFSNFLVAGYYHPDEGLDFRPRRNGFTRVGPGCMFRDREGFLWVAGVRGVARISGRAITNLTSQHGLAEDEVTAITELHDGRIVLGHGTCLTVLESPPRKIDLSRPDVTGRVMSLHQAADGRLLVAATHMGLMSVDPDSGETVQIALPAEHKPPVAQCVTTDASGNVLVATHHRVAVLNGTSVGPDLYTTRGTRPFIRHAAADDTGLYLAIHGLGLVRIANGETTTWTQGDPNANDVFCCQPVPAGPALVGSGEGVLQATADGRLRPATFGGDAIHRPVYSIATSEDGRTWFGTDDGLIVWDGSSLRRITKRTGTAGREANRGAAICDSRGNMWFGFEDGVTTYHVDRERPPDHGPSVELLPRLVNGRPARAGTTASDEDSLTFRFRSISMRDEEQLLHQYRIEGRTDEWSAPEALPHRRIDVAALPPGRYRLHVRVVDSVGMRATATGPWFTIELPVQRRWWFWFLAGAGLIAACSTLLALVAQRRRNRKLHDIVDERTSDLTAERNRLQTTLSSIADGIIGVDASGRITLWNAMASTLTGHAAAAVAGRRLSELLPAFVDEPAGHATVEAPIANGSLRCFDVSTTSIGGDPRNGLVLAFRDVTDQREQERLLRRTERLESLGVLAGGIAHDFNNLLAVMLGNLSLIEPANPEQDGERLRQIQDAVVRSRDLTQQLLTFSKGGAPVRRTGSLADVLRESAGLALSGSNVRCQLRIDDDLHAVAFDTGQISQVIHNLVLNARQAMPDGGNVELRACNSDRSVDGTTGRFVTIEVRDDGPGIPAELGERIFDPYFSTKPYGNGLGLATSHSIVKQHDGQLTVSAPDGGGATFRIDLPASTAPRPADEPDPPTPGADAAVAESPPRRVLCMDDEEAIRLMLQHMLASLGHRADVVEDSAGVLRCYREAMRAADRYDLVILDLTIPGDIGGKATLQRLVEIDPQVTAIAATGYSIEPILGDFDRHGFRAALSKPFSREDLAKAIARACGTAST